MDWLHKAIQDIERQQNKFWLYNKILGLTLVDWLYGDRQIWSLFHKTKYDDKKC